MSKGSLRELESSGFTSLIAGKRPVLADFSATWCGPCKAMEPVVERLAAAFAGQVEVIKVNIDNSPDLAARYGVRGVPSFLLFVGGKPIERIIGATSEKALAALIEPFVDANESADDRTAA